MITQMAPRQSQRPPNSWSTARPVDGKAELRNVLFVLAAAALTFVLASYVAYRRFSPVHLTFASSATLHGDQTCRYPTDQFGLQSSDGRHASR